MTGAELCLTCALGILALQAGSFLLLGASILIGRPLSELATGRLMAWTYGSCFLLSLITALSFWCNGQDNLSLSLGEWTLPQSYEFHGVLRVDALALPFLVLATLLCGVVGRFSQKYLHREPGYHRFFLLLCLFGLGDCLTLLAGSIETLYVAWEMLGLTSALLIGFFHQRPGPVQNGLYTFAIYRFCDLCLALAAVSIYHLAHTGDFASFLGQGNWPHQVTTLTPRAATWVGLLILVAALGKAAQLPFSGWLRRAMEGPTPSTAIFYGALSVHAGAYLLLRFSPLLDASMLLSAITFLIGLTTALWGRAVGMVQNDVKCSLAFASLTQVGLIVAEIGLGFRLLPIVHAVGHALLRSIQFLRAPSLLHELHQLHRAIGIRPNPPVMAPGFYRAPLELFYLEAWLERAVVAPFLSLCRALRRTDQKILDRFFGVEPR